MHVFLAWGSDQPDEQGVSRQLARALGRELRHVFPDIDFFQSDVSLAVGRSWQPELMERLASSVLCIALLTEGNLHRPWLLFEVGSVAKAGRHAVVPVLLGDLRDEQLNGNPIGMHTTCRWSREGFFAIVKRIGRDFVEQQLRANTSFDLHTFFDDVAERADRAWIHLANAIPIDDQSPPPAASMPPSTAVAAASEAQAAEQSAPPSPESLDPRATDFVGMRGQITQFMEAIMTSSTDENARAEARRLIRILNRSYGSG